MSILKRFFFWLGIKETQHFVPKGYEYLGSYNPNVDPSTTNEFNHCAFRVYHANLAPSLDVYDFKYNRTDVYPLDDCDDGLGMLEDRYDDVTRGLLLTPSRHAPFSSTVSIF